MDTEENMEKNFTENLGDILAWSALEYEERERGVNWFWALGVIIITAVATSVIYNNYFFAVLILLGGGLLWFFGRKSPELIEYRISEKGLRIKSHIYLYSNIKSFWVKKEEKPTLFLKTERFFMPVLSIPIASEDAENIKNIFLLKNVPEEEMWEHPSEKIMDTLGF
ncbi:hypothetical protein A3D42_01705 [Candidatus Nomurabacteria bacterium RIFCSPHIGHO2_02_FULL_41_18]|uniref:DUF5673 domain-containing protein n=1 Tax=Candidatus Nomurabacteria bacterium RIFCSPHIGHO2_02_FULL_41_18 TaxID=1801754 RepID=A0A1F6W874_9BACT|nr:MAG: hypothetical protein A2737_01650 [Candidatus Nomurabacteria bacterium RIFCSPHIGHO2_01_FULL_41_71]OGI77976.1 MAG: hypothetical protein A3D42_01705 [Candidatus Nomurabacteria bacterium RIFCSPHIGHO2_02_FULL_41_18]OGI90255.1 MAG: hypothetical protein A3B01_03030 [Candidatus Nomurabacteria bacterium RIFCSPLOWO2_01_FULL_41_52b]OGJ00416.1 MAG: hypothetical protein A3I90_00815 [Candidatus Nomurabacteria bacterium RIFCSPLOWO2_02_FULL_41_9]